MKKVLVAVIMGLLCFSMLSMLAPHAVADLPGDLNLDGKVDILDMMLAANAFGSSEGELAWNPLADMDGDGQIKILDLILIGRNYGLTSP
jgi:hypothetical protein